MYKVIKQHFYASKQDLDRLFECNRISAQIWNFCVITARDYYKQHSKWITKSELQTLTKKQYPIHSQSIQAVVHKFIFARDAIKQARANGRKNLRFPYKKKHHFNTKWANNGFTINYANGSILLSMGTWNGKQQKPIKVHCKFIPDNVKEIELNYHNGLELCFAYDDSSTNIVNTGTNEAAIDLGEIHTIASVCSNGNSIIITGRKLRSIKQFRNKKYAELQRLLSKCKKGSRQWKKYNKAKQHMLAQTDKQILDVLHKITHKYVEFAVANEVKTVYIGKLEGVQRNTRKKKTKSHKVSQKLSQFMFGKVRQLLEYKLKAKGITLKEVDESYTSMTCPVCDRLKKPRGRVYSCVCGYRQHRDIHGSSNILTKQMYGKFQPMKIKPFSYERIA